MLRERRPTFVPQSETTVETVEQQEDEAIFLRLQQSIAQESTSVGTIIESLSNIFNVAASSSVRAQTLALLQESVNISDQTALLRDNVITFDTTYLGAQADATIPRSEQLMAYSMYRATYSTLTARNPQFQQFFAKINPLGRKSFLDLLIAYVLFKATFLTQNSKYAEYRAWIASSKLHYRQANKQIEEMRKQIRRASAILAAKFQRLQTSQFATNRFLVVQQSSLEGQDRNLYIGGLEATTNLNNLYMASADYQQNIGQLRKVHAQQIQALQQQHETQLAAAEQRVLALNNQLRSEGHTLQEKDSDLRQTEQKIAEVQEKLEQEQSRILLLEQELEKSQQEKKLSAQALAEKSSQVLSEQKSYKQQLLDLTTANQLLDAQLKDMQQRVASGLSQNIQKSQANQKTLVEKKAIATEQIEQKTQQIVQMQQEEAQPEITRQIQALQTQVALIEGERAQYESRLQTAQKTEKMLQERLKDTQEQIVVLTSRSADMQNKLSQKITDFEKEHQQVQQLSAELEGKTVEFNELQQQLLAQEAKIAQLNSQTSDLPKIEEQRIQIQKLIAEKDQLQRSLSDQSKAIDQAIRENKDRVTQYVAELESKKSTLASSEAQKSLKDQRIAQLEALQVEAKARIDTLSKEKQNIKDAHNAEKTKLESQLDIKTKEYSQLYQQVLSSEQKIIALDTANKQIAALKDQLDETKSTIQKLQSDLQQAIGTISETKTANTRLEAELKIKQVDLEKYTSQQQVMMQAKSTSEKQIAQLQQELINLESRRTAEDQRHRETLQQQQQLLQQNMDAHQKALREAQAQQEYHQATINTLQQTLEKLQAASASAKDVDSVKQELIKATLLQRQAEERETAQKLRADQIQQQMVQRDAEIAKLKDLYTTASQQEINIKNQLSQLQRQSGQETQALQQTIRSLQNEIQVHNTNITERSNQLLVAQQEQKTAKDQYEVLLRQKEALLVQLREQTQSSQEAVKLKLQIAQINGQLKQGEEDLTAYTQKYVALQTEYDMFKAQSAQVQHQSQAQIDALMAAIKKKDDTIQEQLDQMRQLEERLKAISTTTQNKKQEIEKQLRLELAQLNKSIEAKNALIEISKKNAAELQSSFDKLQTEVVILRQQAITYANRISSLDIELKKAQLDLVQQQNVERGLREKIQQSPSAEKAEDATRRLKDAEQKILELEQIIERSTNNLRKSMSAHSQTEDAQLEAVAQFNHNQAFIERIAVDYLNEWSSANDEIFHEQQMQRHLSTVFGESRSTSFTRYFRSILQRLGFENLAMPLQHIFAAMLRIASDSVAHAEDLDASGENAQILRKYLQYYLLQLKKKLVGRHMKIAAGGGGDGGDDFPDIDNIEAIDQVGESFMDLEESDLLALVDLQNESQMEAELSLERENNNMFMPQNQDKMSTSAVLVQNFRGPARVPKLRLNAGGGGGGKDPYGEYPSRFAQIVNKEPSRYFSFPSSSELNSQVDFQSFDQVNSKLFSEAPATDRLTGRDLQEIGITSFMQSNQLFFDPRAPAQPPRQIAAPSSNRFDQLTGGAPAQPPQQNRTIDGFPQPRPQPNREIPRLGRSQPNPPEAFARPSRRQPTHYISINPPFGGPPDGDLGHHPFGEPSNPIPDRPRQSMPFKPDRSLPLRLPGGPPDDSPSDSSDQTVSHVSSSIGNDPLYTAMMFQQEFNALNNQGDIEITGDCYAILYLLELYRRYLKRTSTEISHPDLHPNIYKVVNLPLSKLTTQTEAAGDSKVLADLNLITQSFKESVSNLRSPKPMFVSDVKHQQDPIQRENVAQTQHADDLTLLFQRLYLINEYAKSVESAKLSKTTRDAVRKELLSVKKFIEQEIKLKKITLIHASLKSLI